nr:hypothetical protein pPsy0462c_00054 [Pseudomonas syringae]
MVWFMRTPIATVLSGPALVCSQSRLSHSLWMRLPLKCVGIDVLARPDFDTERPISRWSLLDWLFTRLFVV